MIPYLKYYWMMKGYKIRRKWWKFMFFLTNNNKYFYFPNVNIEGFIILDCFNFDCPICHKHIPNGRIFQYLKGGDLCYSIYLDHLYKDELIEHYGIELECKLVKHESLNEMKKRLGIK